MCLDTHTYPDVFTYSHIMIFMYKYKKYLYKFVHVTKELLLLVIV